MFGSGGLFMKSNAYISESRGQRACDLKFIMISSLASKFHDFKFRGLQFYFIIQLKNRHPNFKAFGISH